MSQKISWLWSQLCLLIALVVAAVFGPSMMQALARNNPAVESAVKKFRATQADEIKQMAKEHTEELKKMKEAAVQEKAAFEKQEKEVRGKFFQETAGGSERRAYVQSFIQRRADLKKKIADRISAFNSDYSEKLKAKKYDHAQELKEYKNSLSKPSVSP